jgi:hypothetical protein
MPATRRSQKNKGTPANASNDNEKALPTTKSRLERMQASDAEFADLERTEDLLQQALLQLQTEQASLEQGIVECSSTSPTTAAAVGKRSKNIHMTRTTEQSIMHKKSKDAQAVRRLEQALLMETSSDDDESDGEDKETAESIVVDI